MDDILRMAQGVLRSTPQRRIVAADLDRKARHQELGVVTMGDLIHEWAGHDLMHTIQGERAILQPFIEGCGPWKPYFADHLIEKKE
jgi:hypothetical protein